MSRTEFTEGTEGGEEGEGIYHGGTEARRRGEKGDTDSRKDRDSGRVAHGDHEEYLTTDDTDRDERGIERPTTRSVASIPLIPPLAMRVNLRPIYQ